MHFTWLSTSSIFSVIPLIVWFFLELDRYGLLGSHADNYIREENKKYDSDISADVVIKPLRNV